MKFKPATLIHVSHRRGGRKIPMGRLALKDRRIFFEYDPSFLETALNLSPFKLPLVSGMRTCEDRVFDGLFGIFNDSLPDGWGRLLLDRKILSLELNPQTLSPLDRLRFVQNHGMGALFYEPDLDLKDVPIQDDLDIIAAECLQFQENDDDRVVDNLLEMNGSSAGARPKALVTFTRNTFRLTDNDHPSTEDWVIKFNSSTDPKNMGTMEYAYHLMAIAAGLEVPEAKLFASRKTKGYFGTKRFDRQNTWPLHMHTASGLLHADHRVPSLDYEILLKATLWLTKDIRECEKMFRHAVFNVLTHNRDDHAKNFSFLMDDQGLWRVSPAYDLTFSSGPSGEHCTLVMGEGKNPQRSHLLKLADIVGITPSKAQDIIDEVQNASSQWKTWAQQAGVSKGLSDLIQKALNSYR